MSSAFVSLCGCESNPAASPRGGGRLLCVEIEPRPMFESLDSHAPRLPCVPRTCNISRFRCFHTPCSHCAPTVAQQCMPCLSCSYSEMGAILCMFFVSEVSVRICRAAMRRVIQLQQVVHAQHCTSQRVLWPDPRLAKHDAARTARLCVSCVSWTGSSHRSTQDCKRGVLVQFGPCQPGRGVT